MAAGFLKLCCWICFIGAAALGGWTGQLIAQKRYPLSMIERVNLTPQVRPGEAIQLAQHVDRHDQCDIVVKRTISTAGGQRFFVQQIFEEGFGPLGGDKYILPIMTPLAADHGPARLYSKAYSRCSWVDSVLGWSESEPWTLEFTFADRTITEPRPAAFQNIGTKPPRLAPPPKPMIDTGQ